MRRYPAGKSFEISPKSFRKSLGLSSFIYLVLAAGAGLCFAQAGGLDADARKSLGAKALKTLYDAMTDEDAEVRLLSAKQWGPIQNPAAKGVLKKALKDKNPYVRIAAAESLHQLGDASGVPLLRKMVREAPPEPGEETQLGALLQMRRIAKNKVRIEALNALGRMGNAASKKLLGELLSDNDGSVRDAAAVALARLGETEAMSSFISALGVDDSGLRERAVRAMGEAPSGETVDFLKPFADDPNANVRASMMVALGKTRSMRAIPMLEKGLKDGHPLVRAKAVEALGKIRSSAVIPILQSVLEKPENIIVELYAAAGLARLGEKIDLGTADNALSQRKDHDTRMLAVEVFEARGGMRAIERLRYALADTDAAVRVRAAAALVRLLQERKSDTTSDE